METPHQARLRSELDGGTWILQWDDTTARLRRPSGDVACELPSATIGVWADHYALLFHHTIRLNVYPFGRLSSDADAVAAAAFVRAIYPLYVADQRQTEEIKVYRRSRTWLHAIIEWPFDVYNAFRPAHRWRLAIFRALKKFDTRGWPTELPASLVESSSHVLCGLASPAADPASGDQAAGVSG